LIVLLILIARHRRKMYDTSGWAKYKVQIGENLEDIAERAGVDWKQLALANKLPKPYTLKDGESLMVPPNAKSRRKAPVAKSNSKKESTNETQGPSSSRRQIVMARTIIAVLVGVVVIILVIITLPQEPGPRAEIYDPTPIELTEEAVQEQMEELFGDREVAQEEVMEEIALPKPEDILVQILNGSGTAGEAGKLADRLRVGGYIIDHIGNADRFDYQEMLVYYPDGNEEKAIVVEEYLIELGYNVTVDERNDLGDLVTVIIGQGQ
jgi:murein DD-endopeptidase MepM/ murein hydrolase activator NlpD